MTRVTEVTDAQLVNYLVCYLESKQSLSPYEKGAFARWQESLSRSPEKVNLAGQEIFRAFSSPRGLLGDVFETERVMRYVDNILELETDVEIASAEMAEHFYRDHITHMIRTFLLAFYLAQEAGIDVDDYKLALACLFHDMAVPAQETEEILTAHAQLIRDTFSCYEVSPASVKMSGTRQDFVRTLGSVQREGLSLTKDQLTKTLSKRLERNKHDVLSAFELWTMLKHKDDEDLLRPLLAVALHHADLGPDAVTIKFPELFLLILADELQEWGRKAFMVGVYQVFEENKVTAEINNTQPIKFKFNVSYGVPHITAPGRMKPLTAEPVFGPLIQIEAKRKGLKRLSSSNCEIIVKFTTGKHYVTASFGPYYDSEAEGCWLRLYVDHRGIPEEILELSSYGEEPAELPDSFDEVTLELQKGRASLYLGERNISDYERHISAGPIGLLLRLTELYLAIDTPAIRQLRDVVALGFLVVVVPDAPHEIKSLERKALESEALEALRRTALSRGADYLSYIKGTVSIGRELLTKFREGSINYHDIITAASERVEQLAPE